MSEKTRVLRARRGSPEKKSVSPRCETVSGDVTKELGDLPDVFQILQQIGDSFPLAVSQGRFVEAIAGFACPSSAPAESRRGFV